MPVEDRAWLYSEDTNQQVRLSTSFNVRKEKFYNWRDYLIHPCHPLEEVMGSWPEKPAAYRLTYIYGTAGHSDVAGITVLMQGDVSGLQVLINGKWVAVEPIPNAFVVNMGDQLEILSNGRFRSVEHRAVTNASTARVTIPTFYGPSDDAFIAPAASLVDEQHPALYRGYTFEEYSRSVWGPARKRKTLLDNVKIGYSENNGEWILLWRSI